jgi:hypothetical protein
MADSVEVNIKGVEELQRKFDAFGRNLDREAFQPAAEESIKMVLATQGLQNYPPETDANRPPAPYYVRGTGTYTGTKNNYKSERLGTQFYTEAISGGARTGNRASYAPYVVGTDQAAPMKRIGWRIYRDAIIEKLPEITKIFEGWINRAKQMAGIS